MRCCRSPARRRPPRQQRRQRRRAGWSDAKIDFSGLKAVTAKLKLTAGQLIYNKIKISNATLQATISGGKLSASLPSFQLYGGAGAAALDVDASGKIAAQRIRLSLANFDAYPFLKDSAGFESLEGTGAITLDVSGSGASQRAIVAALSGSAKFEFTNGAIRGINIAKTMRGLTTGILSGWQENAAEKTDFATLGASFKIAKGQAQTAEACVRLADYAAADLVGVAAGTPAVTESIWDGACRMTAGSVVAEVHYVPEATVLDDWYRREGIEPVGEIGGDAVGLNGFLAPGSEPAEGYTIALVNRAPGCRGRRARPDGPTRSGRGTGHRRQPVDPVTPHPTRASRNCP